MPKPSTRRTGASAPASQMRMLLATHNAHKAAEIAGIIGGLPIEWVNLGAFPDIAQVEEDGATIEDNAAKKALFPARASGLWTLADDTGLEVAALNGEPGVLSARYAGDGCDYAANNAKLLEALQGFAGADRAAAFRCVMALASPEGHVILEEGRIDGFITECARGEGGFGYDPIFFVTEAGKTLAEMTAEEKNAISHRARALGRMRPHLAQVASEAGPVVRSAKQSPPESCPVCGLEMAVRNCREACPNCGYQIEC